MYTRDLLLVPNSMTTTFDDGTAILCVENTAEKATMHLQHVFNSVVEWTKKWRIKLKGGKSVHVNFTNKRITYHPSLFDVCIPYAITAKYLGIALDAKLFWKEHIKRKKIELNLKLSKMKWLFGRRSNLSIHNKLLLYKQLIKSV